MEDHKFRRSDDIAITELTVQLKDFLDRYERDTRRAESERTEMFRIIRAHDDFIRELKPLYSKGMVILGAFILGFVGLLAKTVWDHVTIK